MGLILNIETSTKVCSIAVHKDGLLIGNTEFFEDQSHSRLITEQIAYLLKSCNFSMQQLDAVAVSKGPGSYTGLRIGVATAKGICYAIDKPLIGVNTLQAMVEGLKKYNVQQYLLCPMLDARRMEVYCCLSDSDGNFLLPTQALIIEETSFDHYLKSNNILFFGNGSDKCKYLFHGKKGSHFITDINPSAVNIGILSSLAFRMAAFEDTAYFEPFYLKEFVSTQIKKDGN